MSDKTYEYSFRTASQCRDLQGDKLYFDWFLQQSISRVAQAAIALRRLVDGRDEFDALTIGTVRSHMATVNLINQGFMDLRTHFGNFSDKMEEIQDAMCAITIDADSAQEDYSVLAKAFGGTL